MTSVFDILYMRRPVLNYVCPPICEAIFSGSGQPVIVLDPLTPPGSVTGLVRTTGVGYFRVSWNNYPGVICYNIYRADDPNNPFGTYSLVSECSPNNYYDIPFNGPSIIRITPITPDGEGPPSDPITIPAGSGGANVLTVVASAPEARFNEDVVNFVFSIDGSTATPTTVEYSLSGTAELDTDFTLDTLPPPPPLSFIIPAGQSTFEIPINLLEYPLVDDATIILTILGTPFYIVGVPGQATVTLPFWNFEWEEFFPTNLGDPVGTVFFEDDLRSFHWRLTQPEWIPAPPQTTPVQLGRYASMTYESANARNVRLTLEVTVHDGHLYNGTGGSQIAITVQVDGVDAVVISNFPFPYDQVVPGTNTYDFVLPASSPGLVEVFAVFSVGDFGTDMDIEVVGTFSTLP